MLQEVSQYAQPYGLIGASSAEERVPSHALYESLAYPAVLAAADSPPSSSSRGFNLPATEMNASIDFGDTTGIQTRGKKQKKKAAQQAKWFDSDNEGEGATAGDGGGDGAGEGDGGGGNAGGDGGGDDNNGGGGDDDDWDFGGSKKSKKKNKKKQEEEEKKKQEEEEQKKKEEEEAAKGAADPLSWADETNAAADEDWTMGFGSKKDKKKKNKKVW